MAVALTTCGRAEPKSSGFCGRLRVAAELGCDGCCACPPVCACWAIAAVASAIPTVSVTPRTIGAETLFLIPATAQKSLYRQRYMSRLYRAGLNPSLAANALQREIDGKSAALPELPDPLIVALPRYAKLKTFVLIGEAEAMAHRFETVGDAERILVGIAEVEHGRSEHRPVGQYLPATGEPQLFLVAKILDGRRNVAIEAEITDLGIG